MSNYDSIYRNIAVI